MRSQILKINGVTPAQIGPLHTALGSSIAAVTSDQAKANDSYLKNYDGSGSKTVTPNILSSKFDAEYGTYTIEIQVPISCELTDSRGGILRNSRSVFAPRSIIDLIYGILEIYPEATELRSN